MPTVAEWSEGSAHINAPSDRRKDGHCEDAAHLGGGWRGGGSGVECKHAARRVPPFCIDFPSPIGFLVGCRKLEYRYRSTG